MMITEGERIEQRSSETQLTLHSYEYTTDSNAEFNAQLALLELTSHLWHIILKYATSTSLLIIKSHSQAPKITIHFSTSILYV